MRCENVNQYIKVDKSRLENTLTSPWLIRRGFLIILIQLVSLISFN